MKRVLFLTLALSLLVSGCTAAAGHGMLYCSLLQDRKLVGLDVQAPDGTRVRLGALDSQVDPAATAIAQTVASTAVLAAKLFLAIP